MSPIPTSSLWVFLRTQSFLLLPAVPFHIPSELTAGRAGAGGRLSTGSEKPVRAKERELNFQILSDFEVGFEKVTKLPKPTVFSSLKQRWVVGDAAETTVALCLQLLGAARSLHALRGTPRSLFYVESS